MVLVAIFAAPSSLYIFNRFSFGIDAQNYPCIPEYRIYLIDKGDKNITKGKLFAFKSQYIKGIAIKYVDGMANDRVAVNGEETTINDSMVGEGLLLAKESGHTEQELTRTGVIPIGHLWMMGRTKISFDSRYWGIISEQDIIGRAYPIW
ncbi:signal peptidase I [Xenorhabdus sp. TH1]|uniref:signal peptidase I n=1 Tax=Xenorhabdus sp. TH1 TaxID=3130166 RepID=UPI0030CE53F2